MKAGYYESVSEQKFGDVQINIGRIIFAYPCNEHVDVVIGNSIYTYDIDEFQEHFQYVDEGEEKYLSQMREVLQSISNTDNSVKLIEHKPINTEISSYTPDNLESYKKSIAEARNKIAESINKISCVSDKLRTLLAEQLKIASVQSEKLQNIIDQAEEAIWSINLYLGKNEEIHKIKSGKRANKDEKICIRQRVLYMDEECSLYEPSGVCIETIEQFDKWIASDPKHIEQCIPEEKCIVAFHIRRNEKDYGDPIQNIISNNANIHWTYFLIRNGENLYRIYVDIDAGDNLFPTEKEYNDLFMADDGPIKPGTDAYYRALEKSDNKSKHYMRILLLLQGIIDRTKIFKPMEVDRINLSDASNLHKYVKLIRDNENVLGDGKPSYADWSHNINKKIDVGSRIVCTFDYRMRWYGGEYCQSRIHPRTSSLPPKEQVYVVSKTATHDSEEMLVVYYDRDEAIFDKHLCEYRKPLMKARCLISRHDPCVINFDMASEEDIKYYLYSREARKTYSYMVPLLELCLKLKQKEREEEEPFRLLLKNKIQEKHGKAYVDILDSTIQWWKTKNKIHRGLIADDKLAYTQILREYDERIEQQKIFESHDHEWIITEIKERTSAIYIAHKKNNKYVSYTPHGADNVWVIEHTWVLNDNSIMLSEEKQWRTVDNRHKKWRPIYQSDRWDEWKINPKQKQIITKDQFDKIKEEWLQRYREHCEENNIRFMPLKVWCDTDFVVYAICACDEFSSSDIIIHNNHYVYVHKYKIKWEKSEGKLSVKFGWLWNDGRRITYDGEIDIKDYTYLESYDENIASLKKQYEKYKCDSEKATTIIKRIYDIIDKISDEAHNRTMELIRDKLRDDYLGEDLIEEKLRKTKIDKQHFYKFQQVLRFMANKGIDCAGHTVADVIDIAKNEGYMTEAEDDLPMDYVIRDSFWLETSNE